MKADTKHYCKTCEKITGHKKVIVNSSKVKFELHCVECYTINKTR